MQRESERWHTLGEHLAELDDALADLRAHTTMDAELATALPARRPAAATAARETADDR
ncbi:hypothetical protein QF035_009574 [Streptomyces umbrinus]|uniref:Uncharacterized protein n=1 Tax=Streptomyces umbrinus TaxID=67370 RepID=A0ABU0T8M5_9ACTN|nr:hypothetical protein [Streptomyces umbrinus]MDQ1031992.1 hypothetical protein [Streptomyces umbrinus]